MAFPKPSQRIYLLLTFIGIFLSRPVLTHADHGAAVSITIDAISGIRCFDGWPDEHFSTGCSKPDFFVMARFELSNGDIAYCSRTATTENIIFAGGFTVSCPAMVPLPFRLLIEVWDDDEHLGNPDPANADQADLDPNSAGLAAVIDSSALAPVPRVFLFTGGDATLVTTITMTPVRSTLTPLVIQDAYYTNPPAFDPAGSEIVHIKSTIPDPTRVTLTFAELIGGTPQQEYPIGTYLISGGIMDITWDGKQNNAVLRNGTYRITARTTGGATSSADVVIFQRSPNVIRFRSIEPGRKCNRIDCWNFGAGPVDIGFLVSASVRLGVEVRGPASQADVMNTLTCMNLPIVRTITPIQVNRGEGVIPWNGLNDSGAAVLPGGYCFRLINQTPAGTGSYPGTGMLVVASEPLRLIARTDPAIPALFPNRPVRIVASAINQAGAFRYTDTITISAGTFTSGTAGTPPTPAFTCRRAVSCAFTLPPAIASGPTVSFSATAFDAGGAPTATVPLRLTDLQQQPGVVIRVNTATRMMFDGTFLDQPHNRVIDLALFPGTGYDLTVNVQALLFDEIVAATEDVFFGAGSPSSSVAENIGNFSLWVSTTPAIVSNAGGPGAHCDYSITPVSFAESQGVLHRLLCRDNADRNSGVFSSSHHPTILWHEFHHSAYDLADEYCCDSPYFEGNPANAYKSLASCQANSLQAANCVQIECVCPPAPAMCGCPGGRNYQTGWWMSDPQPDLMKSGWNAEQADEMRAALAAYVRCRSGGC